MKRWIFNRLALFSCALWLVVLVLWTRSDGHEDVVAFRSPTHMRAMVTLFARQVAERNLWELRSGPGPAKFRFAQIWAEIGCYGLVTSQKLDEAWAQCINYPDNDKWQPGLLFTSAPAPAGAPPLGIAKPRSVLGFSYSWRRSWPWTGGLVHPGFGVRELTVPYWVAAGDIRVAAGRLVGSLTLSASALRAQPVSVVRV